MLGLRPSEEGSAWTALVSLRGTMSVERSWEMEPTSAVHADACVRHPDRAKKVEGTFPSSISRVPLAPPIGQA